MTDIDQLRAIKREKEQELDAATKALDDALIAEKLAEFAAMGGVIGATKVRPSSWKGRSKANMSEGPFLVVGAYMRYGRAVYNLARIKKDGTASNASNTTRPDHVVIVPEDNQ